MNIFRFDELNLLSTAPATAADFNDWIQLQDAIQFLSDEIQDEYIILYGSRLHTYISSMLIPDRDLTESEMDSLTEWQPIGDHAWGVWTGPDGLKLEASLDSESNPLMKSGEPLFYSRSFEGDSDLASYFELPEKLTHVLDIHYVEHRKAWCKLDHQGDIIDVAKLITVPGDTRASTFLVIQREALSEYATLTGTQLLRMFDFTRYKPSQFNGWNRRESVSWRNDGFIKGKFGIIPGYASYFRGVQIVQLAMEQEQLRQRLGLVSSERDYATFVAQDRKHNRIAEISSNPAELDSYFEDTGKPLQISPVFFRQEVLQKYKSNREKYSLEKGSISCRGSWYLKTYDINEAGQVHTYITYLGDLPYEEQLHWKSFNEPPKTGISERAYARDIEGAWHPDDDPLSLFKEQLTDLNSHVTWWSLPDPDALKTLHHPVTESQDEWASDLLSLHQVLIEGMSEKRMRELIRDSGQTPNQNFRSLKLLEQYLTARGVDARQAYELMGPFQELNDLRNKASGHRQGKEARELIRKAKRDYGSLRAHYKALVASLAKNLEELITILTE